MKFSCGSIFVNNTSAKIFGRILLYDNCCLREDEQVSLIYESDIFP